MCFSKKVIMIEGHVTKSSRKALENLLQGGGRVGGTENTLLYWNFQCLHRKFRLLFPYLGRLGAPRRMGNSRSTRGRLFRPRRPLPGKQMPFKFVRVSILATCGITTTSWNCKSAARINVLPPSKKKNDSAHIWRLRIGLFWMNKKERVWYNSWWGVCSFSCHSL